MSAASEATQFKKGSAGGPGYPYAAKRERFRKILLSTVKTKDLKAVILALLAKAKNGEVPAAKELLERLLGKEAFKIDAPPMNVLQILLEEDKPATTDEAKTLPPIES